MMKNINKMWKSWVFRFLRIGCFLLVVIGLTNFIVDPLWTFGHNGWWNKYRAAFNDRQQKTNYLPHIIDEIDGIVIGSSMSSRLHTQDFHGLKIYNYACGGLQPKDAAEFIRHAAREKSDGLTAFIGLDFWNTIPLRREVTYESPEFYLQNTKQKYKNIVSTDALLWSLKSLCWSLWSIVTGKNNLSSELYIFSENFPVAFAFRNLYGKNVDEQAKWIGSEHFGNYENYTALSLEKAEKTLTNLDVTPVFFITPVTSAYLGEMIEVGAYPTYERFIRDTVNLFGSVWNFMYLNSVTVSDQYFFDVNHTNSRGGRAIAQRISGGSDCPADFGILVTKENLEEHIRFLRANIFDALSADREDKGTKETPID